MSDTQTAAEERIAVTVLTGFLGSGKPTLLNKLLSRPELADTAVIINEFGEIGLDHLLVEKSDDEGMVTLNSGCLCCTVRGDLVRTMSELFLKRAKGEVTNFKRMVVETTGLADPAPILHTLMTDPPLAPRYRLPGVVTPVASAPSPPPPPTPPATCPPARRPPKTLVHALRGADEVGAGGGRLRCPGALSRARPVAHEGHPERQGHRQARRDPRRAACLPSAGDARCLARGRRPQE